MRGSISDEEHLTDLRGIFALAAEVSSDVAQHLSERSGDRGERAVCGPVYARALRRPSMAIWVWWLPWRSLSGHGVCRLPGGGRHLVDVAVVAQDCEWRPSDHRRMRRRQPYRDRPGRDHDREELSDDCADPGPDSASSNGEAG